MVLNSFTLTVPLQLFQGNQILEPVSRKARKLDGPEGKDLNPNLLVKPFLAHKQVSFASLTGSFIVLFSKLLKLWSWMQTQQTQNSFPGQKSYRDFREMGHWSWALD